MGKAYKDIYKEWQNDPAEFWAEAAKDTDWIKPFEKAYDPDAGIYGKWFTGGTCNTCYNAVDRHVERGRPGQTAIIYDSPVTNQKISYSYAELLTEVKALAGVLQDFNIEKGDRVIIYMPMIPEALFAMLACARIGAVHSVVFGGFAAKELATRIDDAKPKAIITASCGIEPNRVVEYKPLLDKAIELSKHKPEKCLVLQRPQAEASMIEGRDFDYSSLIDDMKIEDRDIPCVEMDNNDPLYILYTSGTTGIPKGVVRENAGHMVALKWSMDHIYNIEPGDVFWAASDVGWVVGHSYIVYAPLLHGCTTIVYEGKPVGTPDASAFWRVISENRVKALFTAPTAFRAIKREDPEGKLVENFDLSSLETLFLAGERADPDTVQWAENTLQVPVIDHWWQTETGWTISGYLAGRDCETIKHGSAGKPMPGYQIDILNEQSEPLAANEMGSIGIKLPMPPSCLPTLWQNDKRFKDSYLSDHKGYYTTGDAGYYDEDGYLYIMSRTDDIINVAGHRLSTGGMEEVLTSHKDIAECAVMGIKDELKGQIPCGLVVLNAGVDRPDAEIEAECVALIREKIGPVAAFKRAHVVKRLPKTRSGKILRATLRKIADGEEFAVPATIDDPAILDEVKAVLES